LSRTILLAQVGDFDLPDFHAKGAATEIGGAEVFRAVHAVEVSH
jgi:hypothetical protein